MRPYTRAGDDRPTLGAVIAASCCHAAVVGLVSWLSTSLNFPSAEPVTRSRASRAERIAYVPVQSHAPTTTGSFTKPARTGPRVTPEAVAPPLPVIPIQADTVAFIAATISEGTTVSRPGPLYSPFVVDMDPRFVLPSAVSNGAAPVVHRVLSDSMRAWAAQQYARNYWVVGDHEAKFGVSRGRLHLGTFWIPAPKLISLQDADPRIRDQRSMLAEVREQAERRWRDSIVSAPRRP
jgi:hypothetical protein